MTRRINSEGLTRLKQWEGLRLKAYRDAGGVFTIGYGHTGKTGAPIPKQGVEITKAEAEAILARDLRHYEACVENTVQVPLNDAQFAALVSFAFNIGIRAFQASTLVKKLNAGDYDCVPHELQRWNKIGGKISQGLANRRAAEAGLFVSGAFVASNHWRPDLVHLPNIKRNALAPLFSAMGGIGALVTGNGAVQIALAVLIILAGGLSMWALWQHNKHV